MVAYSVAIVACLMIFTVGYAVADYALTSAGVYDLPGFFSSVAGPVETGQVEITDNLNFALTDAQAKSAVSGASIYILDTEGGVLEGPLTTASNGIIASGREYKSGTHLKIEVAKSGYVTQFYDYVVPTMSEADLSKNPTTHYTKDLTITYLGTYSISVVDSSGTSYTTGSTTYNWTDKGVTTDTFTITIRETVANRGWASSYDPINKQAQNVVVQMYFNGSGYQSIANGYSSSYTWGSVKSWFKTIDDSTLCRQTQGASVLKEGITTFTITVNQGAFASGCEQLTVDLRDYFSTTLFAQQGDGGASDASLASFELLFVV
jgi:hypothetical protein